MRTPRTTKLSPKFKKKHTDVWKVIEMMEPDTWGNPEDAVEKSLARIFATKTAKTPEEFAVLNPCGGEYGRYFTLITSRWAFGLDTPSEWRAVADVADQIGANRVQLHTDREGNNWVDFARVLTHAENAAYEIMLHELKIAKLRESL